MSKRGFVPCTVFSSQSGRYDDRIQIRNGHQVNTLDISVVDTSGSWGTVTFNETDVANLIDTLKSWQDNPKRNG